jgi:hypothetical protein
MKNSIRNVRGKRRSNISRAHGGPNITKREISRLISDSRAYLGQQYEVVVLPGTTGTLTTTVTSGVISYVETPSLSRVTGSSRFTAAWDEYRIIHVSYELYPLTVSTGVICAWFDEKSSASPTTLEAQERNTAKFLCTNAHGKVHHMVWEPRDLLDLEYVSSSNTSTTSVYFKVYTEASGWGATAVATPIWVVKPTLTVEFRGLKST